MDPRGPEDPWSLEISTESVAILQGQKILSDESVHNNSVLTLVQTHFVRIRKRDWRKPQRTI